MMRYVTAATDAGTIFLYGNWICLWKKEYHNG